MLLEPAGEDVRAGHDFVELHRQPGYRPFEFIVTEACARGPCLVKRVRRVVQAPGGRPADAAADFQCVADRRRGTVRVAGELRGRHRERVMRG